MKFWLKTFMGLLITLTVTIPLMAEPLTDEDLTNVPKGRKFVYLTLGIEYDERVSDLPDVMSFKGDFRKFTSAIYLKPNKAIRFSPKEEGISTLTIHDKSGKKVAEYRIIVRKSKLDAVAREMHSLLGDIEGITIKIINNKVIVDGQILIPRDMSRIYNVVSQFSEASSLVTMSPLAMKKISEFIARDINNPEIEVRALNDKIILQGWANNEDEKKNAVIIAKSYMPAVVLDKAEQDQVVRRLKPVNDGVLDLINVKQQPAAPPPKMVQVVTHYVELNKDYAKSFRFQFMPSLKDDSGIQFSSGSNTSGGVVSQFTATINNLLPKLNWLKAHGHARVLESNTIIVKDGEKATFNSVKEFPQVSINSSTGQATTKKTPNVGIETTVTPTSTGERSDSVDLKFYIKVSAPAGSNPDGPIIATNTLDTSLVVRSSQSAAVGGFIKNNSVTGYNKLPADVSSNPILSLYASKDFARDQTQFVVFVTPIIKSSASAGSEKIKKKFRLRD